MGLFDTALSMGGDLVTGWLNNQYAEDRQNAAQDFSAQQYATRYQTTVKDMQAAGLNPMLAYGQAPGNSPGGVVASSNATPSLGSSYNQSKVTSAQEANIQADTENKKASADLIAAQAAAAWASADQTRTNIGNIEASTNKIIEETKNIPTEGQRLRYAIQLLAEQAAARAQEGETQVSIRKEIEAKIAKLRAETKVIGFDITAAEDLGNLGRYSKEGKIVLDVLRTMKGK